MKPLALACRDIGLGALTLPFCFYNENQSLIDFGFNQGSFCDEFEASLKGCKGFQVKADKGLSQKIQPLVFIYIQPETLLKKLTRDKTCKAGRFLPRAKIWVAQDCQQQFIDDLFLNNSQRKSSIKHLLVKDAGPIIAASEQGVDFALLYS